MNEGAKVIEDQGQRSGCFHTFTRLVFTRLEGGEHSIFPSKGFTGYMSFVLGMIYQGTRTPSEPTSAWSQSTV